METNTASQRFEPVEFGQRYIRVGTNLFDTHSQEGRMAARAFAWTARANGELWLSDRIIKQVGRDDK